MKIAVLALGSLATNPVLKLDGPLLPIEFTWDWDYPPGRLILALCDKKWAHKVRIPWFVSMLDDLNQARRDLAEREGVRIEEIGYVKMDAHSISPQYFNQGSRCFFNSPYDTALRE